MSHLNKLSFTNFRVFNKKSDFNIRPITFLTGPNSSGKSSILKGLLLLKSNYSNDLQVLDFSGPKHNLGTFEKTVNVDYNQDNCIVIGLTAKLGSRKYQGTFIKQPVTTRRSVYTILREFDKTPKTEITIELSYKGNEPSGKLKKIELFHQTDTNAFLSLEIGERNTDSEHSLFLDPEKLIKDKVLRSIFFEYFESEDFEIIKKVKAKKYKSSTIFALKSEAKDQYISDPVSVFTRLYEKFLEDNVSFKKKRDLHPYIISQPLRRILKDFSEIVDNVEYLEAVRANTKRVYTNDSQGTSFNELILEYKSRDISDISLQFTNKWLKKFDIAEELLFKNIEGVATTIYLKKGNKEIALADLGYGITQFLPILLKISLEEPIRKNQSDLTVVKKLILLEEPETNLHPKLQSLVADFLIDAIKTFEVRFIIETHSEYIIRKIQILTAEKEMNCSDTIIYYFNETQNIEQNKTIEIDVLENGTLTNDFGTGFFDEATNLKIELLKSKIAK